MSAKRHGQVKDGGVNPSLQGELIGMDDGAGVC
jgi:hypothetical protein